jgi:hypothetical protein
VFLALARSGSAVFVAGFVLLVATGLPLFVAGSVVLSAQASAIAARAAAP